MRNTGEQWGWFISVPHYQKLQLEKFNMLSDSKRWGLRPSESLFIHFCPLCTWFLAWDGSMGWLLWTHLGPAHKSTYSCIFIGLGLPIGCWVLRVNLLRGGVASERKSSQVEAAWPSLWAHLQAHRGSHETPSWYRQVTKPTLDSRRMKWSSTSWNRRGKVILQNNMWGGRDGSHYL